MKIKRTKYLFFYHRKFPKLDFNLFLGKDTNPTFEDQVVSIPILYGKEVILTKTEFEKVISIKDNDWEEFNDDNISEIEKFLNLGIIISQNDNYKVFREREETLINDKWHIYSALFNFMTKWRDIDVKMIAENIKVDSSEEMKIYIENNGRPPLHYHEHSNLISSIKIDYEDKSQDDFFKLLLNRKTTRNFDKNKKMSFKDLSTLLKYTYGIHGTRSLYDSDIVSVKKTSPSGGDLHPTEVYLLVMRVEGLKEGMYHYNTGKDELSLIKEYSFDEAVEKARLFSAGQEYTSFSSVMFFLTTRYYRNHWKYRKNSAAYSVTVRDAAHLCQTMYLVCTKLNIGCYTAAINHSNIEEEIGLNPYVQGVVMMAGCGVIDENPTILLEPKFDNYN